MVSAANVWSQYFDQSNSEQERNQPRAYLDHTTIRLMVIMCPIYQYLLSICQAYGLFHNVLVLI